MGWKDRFFYIPRDLCYEEGLGFLSVQWQLDTVDLRANFDANILTTLQKD